MPHEAQSESVGSPDRPRAVIMIIRHGEKPTDSDQGVTFDGVPKKKSLTIAGWARAGALVELFAPAAGPLRPGLFGPHALFASNRKGPGGGSDREQETLQLLARRLGLEINLDHGVGQEPALVAAATAIGGPVLISWKHDYITAIADCLEDVNPPPPSTWPEDRYDLVWVFDKSGRTSGYRFSQVPELLLPGDSPTPIC